MSKLVSVNISAQSCEEKPRVRSSSVSTHFVMHNRCDFVMSCIQHNIHNSLKTFDIVLIYIMVVQKSFITNKIF